jgi:hypothetical protein
MDAATRTQIREKIVQAKAKIPELEQDLADARKAGLGDIVKAQEATLAKAKQFIANLDAVYGS